MVGKRFLTLDCLSREFWRLLAYLVVEKSYLTETRGGRIPDEPFAFQMKDNLLRRLLGSALRRIDSYVCIGRFFVRIRDTGKLLDNTRPGFGVETFAVALFTNFNRRGEMHHDKSTERRNHGAHLFPRGIVRSDGSTDGNSPVLGDLGSDVADAPDVEIAMFARKTKLGRQVLADQIPVKKCDRSAPDFVELDQQDVGNS